MIDEPEQLRTVLNWDVALQVERAVTEFEAAWRKGGSTEIESVLQRYSSLPARELFCALLETELELRRRNGEAPEPKRWTKRFPEWGDETEWIVAHSLPGESPAEESAIPLPRAGAEFGRYRIVKEIGRGAMGVVFQAELVGDVAPRLASAEAAVPKEASADANAAADARSTSTNASRGATSPTTASRGATSPTVAIKVIRLPKSLSDDERQAATRRFQTEAAATAALKHPHVIPVLDVGEVDGVPYFTMPLIVGGTLKKLRRDAPIEPLRAARLIEAAARALHQAHRSGLFHRDIKPSNLLLGPDDHVFVSDFGVSMHRDELGQGPNIAGTPLYMSPEQSAGKADLIDGRSDVYSLGLVLYELLTGTHPFDTPLAASAEIIERICHLPVPPLRQRADIPRPLEDICLHALRRQPEDRYSTAGDFADDLRSFIDGANQPPNSVEDLRRARRHSLRWVGLLLVGLCIALGWKLRRAADTTPLDAVNLPSIPIGSPPKPVNPDRAAAEWLLSLKAPVNVRFLIQAPAINWTPESHWEKWVTSGESLPDQEFRITLVRIWWATELTDQEIERWIVPLPWLRSLQLDFCGGFTEAAIPLIKRCTMLHELGLALTPIRGPACLKLFTELPNLKSVVISNDQFTDEMADYFRTTPKIAEVTLHNGGDSQLRQLMSAKQLTGLVFITASSVETATWRELAIQLPKLEVVGANTSNFNTADLTEIARCPNLRELWIQSNPITDADLMLLHSLQHLTLLNLSQTKVTEAGVRDLHERLPNCRIQWDGGFIEPLSSEKI